MAPKKDGSFLGKLPTRPSGGRGKSKSDDDDGGGAGSQSEHPSKKSKSSSSKQQDAEKSAAADSQLMPPPATPPPKPKKQSKIKQTWLNRGPNPSQPTQPTQEDENEIVVVEVHDVQEGGQSSQPKPGPSGLSKSKPGPSGLSKTGTSTVTKPGIPTPTFYGRTENEQEGSGGILSSDDDDVADPSYQPKAKDLEFESDDDEGDFEDQVLVKKVRETLAQGKETISELHEKDQARENPQLRGRSVVWQYFRKAKKDKKDTMAMCKVLFIDGDETSMCKYLINQITGQCTSSMRTHLKGKHNWAYLEMIAIEAVRKQIRQQLEGVAQAAADVIQGTPTKTGTPGGPNTPKTPGGYTRPLTSFIKAQPRGPDQLKFDMEVTKYLVQGNLAFHHVQTKAFKDFCANTELKRYTIKNPTTYSKAKLPLLYKQVKTGVRAKIQSDMPGTTGFALTADLWSSR